MKRLLILLLFLSTLAPSQTVDNSAFFLTSSSAARAAAMGGAFTAVQDFLESSLYNPAALVNQGSEKLLLTFNPIAVTDAVLHRNSISMRNDRTTADMVSMLGLFMRSISISPGPFQFSVLLTEELPHHPHRDQSKKVSTEGLLDWNYHAASVRLKFAKQISMGAGLLIFNKISSEDDQSIHIGTSYGVLLLPSSKFSIGVSLFNLPESARDEMRSQYGLDHHSINFGVCWQPVQPLRLSMDFRNVSPEDSLTRGGIRGGIELIPLRFLALRTGYFRAEPERDVFSMGVGLEDFRRFTRQRERFVLSKILLNYALQVARSEEETQVTHYLTFLLRI